MIFQLLKMLSHQNVVTGRLIHISNKLKYLKNEVKNRKTIESDLYHFKSSFKQDKLNFHFINTLTLILINGCKPHEILPYNTINPVPHPSKCNYWTKNCITLNFHTRCPKLHSTKFYYTTLPLHYTTLHRITAHHIKYKQPTLNTIYHTTPHCNSKTQPSQHNPIRPIHTLPCPTLLYSTPL